MSKRRERSIDHESNPYGPLSQAWRSVEQGGFYQSPVILPPGSTSHSVVIDLTDDDDVDAEHVPPLGLADGDTRRQAKLAADLEEDWEDIDKIYISRLATSSMMERVASSKSAEHDAIASAPPHAGPSNSIQDSSIAPMTVQPSRFTPSTPRPTDSATPVSPSASRTLNEKGYLLFHRRPLKTKLPPLRPVPTSTIATIRQSNPHEIIPLGSNASDRSRATTTNSLFGEPIPLARPRPAAFMSIGAGGGIRDQTNTRSTVGFSHYSAPQGPKNLRNDTLGTISTGQRPNPNYQRRQEIWIPPPTTGRRRKQSSAQTRVSGRGEKEEARLKKRRVNVNVVMFDTSLSEEENQRRADMAKRFGPIEGVRIGTMYDSRMAVRQAGLHAPPMSGISGTGHNGAYSIVSSGGYEDHDFGEWLWYTGMGGRSKENEHLFPDGIGQDQTLRSGNAALNTSFERALPVRVIRGGRSDRSPWEPEWTSTRDKAVYRYDGLYRVCACSVEKSNGGYDVYYFILHRLPGQDPLTVRSGREWTEQAKILRAQGWRKAKLAIPDLGDEPDHGDEEHESEEEVDELEEDEEDDVDARDQS